MPVELLNLLYRIIFPLAWVGIYGLALTAGLILRKRTRNAGPLLLILGSIAAILVQLAHIVFGLILDRRIPEAETIQQFYQATTISSLVGTALAFTGIFLIAKEFRAHLDHQKISQDLPKSP